VKKIAETENGADRSMSVTYTDNAFRQIFPHLSQPRQLSRNLLSPTCSIAVLLQLCGGMQ